eukprot:GDKI01016787.1.p1 GENE.GDKI01016787.1~~GDKI01016787.1.p1  ORF type:complete len:204 (-),score=69.14 GDKI01016787.1:17-553(-)
MLAQVVSILVLDSEGQRMAVKYANTNIEAFKDFNSQQKFEKNLHQKASRLAGRTEVEVVMVDEYIALVRSVNDIWLYLVGDASENELLLLEAFNAVYQGLNVITNNSIGKRQVYDNLDSVFLMLDEVTDGSVLFETDAAVLNNRINMVEGDQTTQTDAMTFNQALQSAKEQVARQFFS